ncbi:MAG: hypothetical protein K9L59_14000 [Desulfobacterales bacterium]|nr:hypothetical protein [Desulfobacterales bacterium]MCF8078502.1 hypothetical protein [Desulfobacterales bacterium]
MAKYAVIISWIGGALFTYVWMMRVGNLRDKGKNWYEALIKENDMIFFGAVGILTLVAMTIAG